MGLKRVSWVRRYQGQCRALQPMGHQGYRLRNYKKDPPLCSGYTRRTHLLVESSYGLLLWVKLGEMEALCIPVHAYGALKGWPHVLRTIKLLFRLPRDSTLRSLRERVEFPKLACL